MSNSSPITLLKQVLTDPRVVAAAVACLWLYFDDLPGEPYGTFHDPGAAALLSIVFAQATALLVLRRVDPSSVGLWLLAVFAKFGLQMLFYVRGAMVLDLLALLAVNLGIAALARKKLHPPLSSAVLCTFIGWLVALFAVILVHRLGRGFDYPAASFWSIAFARVAFPYFFWTAPFIAARRTPTLTPRGSERDHSMRP